jgi:hypothetical protein
MKRHYYVLILFLVSQTSAIQDAYVTVDDKNSGLCFAYGDYNNPVCNASVVTVEGTKDGILYIVPHSEVTSRDNITTQFEYVAFTPLNFFLALTMFIGFLIMVLVVFYAVGSILSGFSGGKR